jgi:hypothetical protein
LLRSLSGSGAAQAAVEKNFISYRITNGFFGHQWYPTDAATSGPSGLAVVEPNVREMQLADIAGPISTILDERFDPFRSKMILMRHIDRLDKSDHNQLNGLFGWSTFEEEGRSYAGLPPSIDQIMANQLFGGAFVPLNLSIRWSEQGGSCSFSITPSGALVHDAGLYPEQAYARLFGDLELDESTATRRRRYRQTIVDRVLPHYRSVRQNPRLGRLDGEILDQHIDHMQQLHQQLSRSAVECAPPASPARFNMTPEAVDAGAQAQIDIAVAAIRCGLVRVVNLYLDPDTLMTNELHGIEGHHAVSHVGDPAAVQGIQNAHLWHMRYLVDLLTKLDASVDPSTGDTLLDNSLVFVNNEIGNQNGRSGNQPDDVDLNHIGLDVQTLLVGSCGGALRTGTFLDYRTDFERDRWTRYVGTAYNRVLISCMLAMGLTPDAWEVNGQPGYGDMRGAQYNKTPLDQVVMGDMRAYLPRISAG